MHSSMSGHEYIAHVVSLRVREGLAGLHCDDVLSANSPGPLFVPPMHCPVPLMLSAHHPQYGCVRHAEQLVRSEHWADRVHVADVV